jgi:ankyrin repeat protein
MSKARTPDSALLALLRAIAAGNAADVSRALAASPDLAKAHLAKGATRERAKPYFLDEIGHYVYAGHTALHVAAAAHRHDIAEQLIALGADVRARNRRGAEPLLYAAVGSPGSPRWDPRAQAVTIVRLIAAGADPNVEDFSGTLPLHRAVRTRCATAVRALLEGGADPRRKTRRGSTAMRLAVVTSGRPDSGSVEAKVQQEEIMRVLRQHGGGR